VFRFTDSRLAGKFLVPVILVCAPRTDKIGELGKRPEASNPLPAMRDLLAELTTVLDQGRACVYCAVVETRGSTPQKAGAAMLVFPDGSQCGTLGGGCVEAEVKQRALRVLTQDVGQPEVLTFCLDDNYGWDDGLICGGRMSILADPLTEAASSATADRRRQ